MQRRFSLFMTVSMRDSMFQPVTSVKVLLVYAGNHNAAAYDIKQCFVT